jgi:hypothetical protein
MKVARPTLLLIGFWLLATVVYGYTTVSSKLALPPSGDLYAHTATYQALSFVLLKLPALLSVLVVLLAFQVMFSHARQSRVSPGGMRLFLGTVLIGTILLIGSLVHYVMTAAVEWNPWFQRDEQLVLAFMLARLPLIAFLLLLVLVGELRWLKSRAR